MKKLFLRGGLGNQLFQFSFMHHNSFPPGERFEIWMVDQKRQDRPFILSPVLPHCEHVLNASISNPDNQNESLWGNVVKFFEVQGKLLTESKEHLYEIFDTSQYDGVFSFFETSRYVDESWGIFGPELLRSLATIENFNPLVITGDYISIHFRRGDFISHNPFGLLGKGYYVEALSRIPPADRAKLPTFGFTDDVENVKDLAAELGVDQLFGPESSTAWQALKSLSEAKYVIAANSTLSWWAAYIASRSGRTTYIPRPWFPNREERIVDCLEFSGANVVQSTFENH